MTKTDGCPIVSQNYLIRVVITQSVLSEGYIVIMTACLCPKLSCKTSHNILIQNGKPCLLLLRPYFSFLATHLAICDNNNGAKKHNK